MSDQTQTTPRIARTLRAREPDRLDPSADLDFSVLDGRGPAGAGQPTAAVAAGGAPRSSRVDERKVAVAGVN